MSSGGGSGEKLDPAAEAAWWAAAEATEAAAAAAAAAAAGATSAEAATATEAAGPHTLGKPFKMDPDLDACSDMPVYAALASEREEGRQDATEACIAQWLRTHPTDLSASMAGFKTLAFESSPSGLRTEAYIQAPDMDTFRVTKGAPQCVLPLVHDAGDIVERVCAAVQEMGDQGLRALGVAISYTGKDATGAWEQPQWELLGLLSVRDRGADPEATAAQARQVCREMQEAV